MNLSTRRSARDRGLLVAGGVRKGAVRIGPLMAVPAVLAEFGVEPTAVLRECGLVPAQFGDPDNIISFATGSRLVQCCAERTGCEHFGLLVGERAPPQSMGAVGYLILSSPTVGAALDALTEHLGTHDRGAIAGLRVEGGVAILSYSILETGLERVDQLYALAMTVGRNLMRGLCGPRWRPDSVTLPFSRPRSVDAYRRCFGVTPRFDAPESALRFSAATLALAPPGADAYLHALMKQRVDEIAAATRSDLAHEVRRLLRAAIPEGGNALPAIAARLDMHERTLKRRLEEEGTSFRAVRDALFFDTACELLEGTRMPVGEIGSLLGYASSAAFTRAFARWSGVTPLRWRSGERAKKSPLGGR